MGGDDFGRAVEFVEAAHGQILDEARAIEAAQDLVAFFVGLKGGPATLHVAPPEKVGTFEDHAIGPDFDPAIELKRLGDDQPIDHGHGDQTGEVDPAAVNRRMIKQVPAFVSRRRRPCEQTPDGVTQPRIEVFVADEDAAFRRENAAVIDVRIRLEAN